jgi:deoxyribonuclease-1
MRATKKSNEKGNVKKFKIQHTLIMPKYSKSGRLSVKFLMAVRTLYRIFMFSLAFFTSFQAVSAELNIQLINFGKAKSILKNKVYGHKNSTFYCKCAYQKKSIKLGTCKILTKKYKKRKTRLEWEHVVPAHAFGQSFSEWRDAKKKCPSIKSRRKCAAQKSQLFKEMEGDMHNIVPAVGAANALRSNYSFIDDSTGLDEICKSRFWVGKRKVSVHNDIKGDIARIYFYMDQKYPGRGIISNKNKKLYKLWNILDPVSSQECIISKKKSLLQGSKNHFVEDFCK